MAFLVVEIRIDNLLYPVFSWGELRFAIVFSRFRSRAIAAFAFTTASLWIIAMTTTGAWVLRELLLFVVLWFCMAHDMILVLSYGKTKMYVRGSVASEIRRVNRLISR